jgi:large subunit ribosomal protein L10
VRAQPESDEMNREEKAAVIDQVAEEMSGADAIFAVDYRGITVAQIKDLRVKLSDQNTTLQVTKNSLAELAADKAGASELKPLLVGPTALAFVKGDAAAAAKILSDTARALRGPLEAKGGYMGGSLLSAAQVSAIAQLPSREVLYGQLVGVVASPISGVVRTLNALIQGLAIQLGSIAEQGLVTGSAPAAPAAEAPAEPAAEAPAEPAAEASAEPAAEAPAEAPEAAEAAPAAEPEAPVEADATTEAASTEDASDDATPTDA